MACAGCEELGKGPSARDYRYRQNLRAPPRGPRDPDAVNCFVLLHLLVETQELTVLFFFVFLLKLKKLKGTM